jgi:hypothetical protein
VSTLTLAPPRFRDLGGEPTLDEHLIGVWEGLAAHHPAACPLCGGEMVPLCEGEARPQAGRVPGAGRCRDCKTVLS